MAAENQEREDSNMLRTEVPEVRGANQEDQGRKADMPLPTVVERYQLNAKDLNALLSQLKGILSSGGVLHFAADSYGHLTVVRKSIVSTTDSAPSLEVSVSSMYDVIRHLTTLVEIQETTLFGALSRSMRYLKSEGVFPLGWCVRDLDLIGLWTDRTPPVDTLLGMPVAYDDELPSMSLFLLGGSTPHTTLGAAKVGVKIDFTKEEHHGHETAEDQ